MPKTIAKKIIGKITYELKLFEGDNKYVIYKKDKDKMPPFRVVRIPEVVKFNSEEEAGEFWERVKIKTQFF